MVAATTTSSSTLSRLITQLTDNSRSASFIIEVDVHSGLFVCRAAGFPSALSKQLILQHDELFPLLSLTTVQTSSPSTSPMHLRWS